MDNQTLNRAIELKKEIECLNEEIKILPVTTRRRRLVDIIGGVLKRNNNKLHVVETYTYKNEVIWLNNDDIECLVQLRKDKVKKLEEEISSL